MTRTIFIGDIHGCLVEFRDLVDKLALTSDDRVICLGDFMDKGPDPAGCVRFARESGFESVMGNHEEKHLRWRKHEDKKRANPTYVNPMKPLPDKYKADNAALSDEDVAWLNACPIGIQLPVFNFVAVHGGLRPGIPLDAQLNQSRSGTTMRLRWINAAGKHVPVDYDALLRGEKLEGVYHWTELYDGRHNVVYGHEAHSLSGIRMDHLPKHDVECYGIDTGCVHGGRLTALVVSPPTPGDGVRLGTLGKATVTSVQVQARKCYEDPLFPIPA